MAKKRIEWYPIGIILSLFIFISAVLYMVYKSTQPNDPIMPGYGDEYREGTQKNLDNK